MIESASDRHLEMVDLRSGIQPTTDEPESTTVVQTLVTDGNPQEVPASEEEYLQYRLRLRLERERIEEELRERQR
jgi:hypothetical protein